MKPLNEMTVEEDKTERTFTWHAHRLSGIIIILLLGFHTISVLTERGATIDSIQSRIGNADYIIINVLMLLIVLFHGLNGVRLMAYEVIDRIWPTKDGITSQETTMNLRKKRKMKHLVTLTLLLIGTLLTLYGTSFLVLLKMKAA